MVDENQQPGSDAKEYRDDEDEVRKSIPVETRASSFIVGVIASVAFGVGTDSFAIGIGTFFALLCLCTEMGSQLKFHRACQRAKNNARQGPISLEQVASQAAKELGSVLAIGGLLERSDVSIIRRRLDEVIQATNAAITACEQRGCNEHSDR